MIARNRFAVFAMSGLLVAVLTPRAARAQQIDPKDDPNLPGQLSPTNLKVQWSQYTKGQPQVIMPGQDHGTSYIGWNDQGSWLVGADDGKIYVWNLKQNSLTLMYKNYKVIPEETLASLHNNQFAVAKSAPPSTGPGGATGEVDPNLPGQLSPTNLTVQWSQYTKGHPRVDMPGQGSSYIGWNDQGSWLVGANDGKIYVWNLKQNSLTLMYKNYKQIPPETLATLRNNQFAVAKGAPQDTGPKQTGPKPLTPDTSRQAAFFSGVGTTPQTAPPGAITGSGATIQNGVLTFTRADKTKATYKVIRPKVAMGAPGSTGAWISLEANGSGIMFTVNADNSVTGRELPAQIIQALTR